MALGNPLEIEVSIGKSPISSVFSVAMFDDTGGSCSYLGRRSASLHTHPFRPSPGACAGGEMDGSCRGSPDGE